MAKKKEGSNLGLIITLVFFVLSTVILGVTTYMGYSDQEKLVKEKDDANNQRTVAENDKNWYRTQARILKVWTAGAGADKELATEVARDKEQFDKGSLASAQKQKDKDSFEKLVKDLNARVPWDASRNQEPPTTIDDLIRRKDKEIESLRQQKTQAEDARLRAEKERDEFRDQKDRAVADLKKAREKLFADSRSDYNNLKGLFDRQQVDFNKANVAKGKAEAALSKTQDELKTAQKQLTSLQVKLGTAAKESRELRDTLEETRERLTALIEKTGQDPRAAEAATLDARATALLREWKRDWRIVEIDRRGNMPYINLGSADGLTPQVTFSVHSAGLDGRLNPIPKGTVEVVRVIGSHLAQVRVTSLRDARKDPILKGDRLFNATWDPNRRKHVAIAGMADLGGDGTDNTEDLRRLLARQKVEIDAYIDTGDEKGPRVVGKGITTNTDFLILGDHLDAVNHPRARDKDFSARFEKLIRDLREQAANNGVQVISLRKYLDLIGYRTPRISATGGNGYYNGYDR